MANKKNLVSRNKGSNNYKTISRLRKEKKEKKAKNTKDNEDDVNIPQSHEALNNDIVSIDVCTFIPQESENYFACLDEEEDDNISINPNLMTNSCETQPNIDPLSSVDDKDDAIGNDNKQVNADVVYIEDLDEGSDEDFDDDEDEYEPAIDEVISENENLSSCDEEEEEREGEGEGEGEGEEEGEEEEEEEEVILEEKLNGRRIFDIGELFQQMKRIGRHSPNCNFEDMKLIGETKQGLNSKFKFQCKKCGVFRKLESCPKKRNVMNCNEDAVLGITAIGSGHSHLNELFTNLNIPVMGNTLYDKIQKQQQSDWTSAAKQSAFDALYEEIELARTLNSVDSMGNALIPVICDGMWGKRSYGKAFNSLSGCAVLIGLRTKKVVFFGTRNKYCHVCKIAQSKCTPVREHDCNIDFQGPSSGMEADIILQGFKVCEPLGARFHQLIADGDSNTYKNIRDIQIYQNPDVFVVKYECVNHLCRNFRSKFTNLSSVTKFDCDLRKHIKPKTGRDICNGVKAAAKHWRESGESITEQISNVEEDVMNAAYHYFGVHDKCKPYFCNKNTEQGAIDQLKLLKDDGIFYEVLNLCQHYFAGNAVSLLKNYTNNPAEEFNNVVAKYIGGKRINYYLARSFSARVAAAVVQYNSGGHASSTYRTHKYGNLENTSIQKMENSRKRKLKANETARQAKPRQKVVGQEKAMKDGYYHGDGSDKLDMDAARFQGAKEVMIRKLKNDQKNWKAIEESTRGGKDNTRWQVIRRKLLPTSFFSIIMKAKQRKSYTGILEELLYKRSEFGNGAAIKHHKLVERDALKIFKNLFDDYDVKDCGILIDRELYYLCASSLKLYGNDHILKIKCPLKEYNKKFDEAIRKIPFWKKEGEHMALNEKSDWFIELQSELHVSGRKYGYIMVWLGEFQGEPQYRIVEVPKDDYFFEKNIKPKLVYFHEEVMVKELVNSRRGRFMPLREYNDEAKSFI